MQLLENFDMLDGASAGARAAAAAAAVAQVSTATALRAQACFDFSSLSLTHSLALALAHWFARHVPPGVYALHITHTQRWLIKVSAKAARATYCTCDLTNAAWTKFSIFLFTPAPLSAYFSHFSHFASYLIFLASFFRCSVCCLRSWNCFLFEVARPAAQADRSSGRERERERREVARIARQSQSQFPRATVAGCLFQVAPEQHNLQILTSKCRSGRSKLHGGTFFRCQNRVGR